VKLPRSTLYTPYTISLSLVGLVAFVVLQGLAALAIIVSSQTSGGAQGPPPKVRLPVSGNG
jgi:hypothetical protein